MRVYVNLMLVSHWSSDLLHLLLDCVSFRIHFNILCYNFYASQPRLELELNVGYKKLIELLKCGIANEINDTLNGSVDID